MNELRFHSIFIWQAVERQREAAKRRLADFEASAERLLARMGEDAAGEARAAVGKITEDVQDR